MWRDVSSWNRFSADFTSVEYLTPHHRPLRRNFLFLSIYLSIYFSILINIYLNIHCLFVCLLRWKHLQSLSQEQKKKKTGGGTEIPCHQCLNMKKHKVSENDFICRKYLPTLNVSVLRPSSGRVCYKVNQTRCEIWIKFWHLIAYRALIAVK